MTTTALIIATTAAAVAGCFPAVEAADATENHRVMRHAPPALVAPCGSSGELCCDGGGDPGLECGAGLACDRTGKPTCKPCGIVGDLCCRGHVGEPECRSARTACDYKAGRVCSTCGGYDEPCCGGLTCDAGLQCWNTSTGDRCGASGPPGD